MKRKTLLPDTIAGCVAGIRNGLTPELCCEGMGGIGQQHRSAERVRRGVEHAIGQRVYLQMLPGKLFHIVPDEDTYER